MSKISIIVSRYKDFPDLSDMENIVTQIREIGHDAKLIVYDKYHVSNLTHKFIPNIGRENFGWNDYVLSTWDNPDDFYVFAHPCSSTERFDKFEMFILLCRNTLDAIEAGKGFATPAPSRTLHADPSYRRTRLHIGGSLANVPDVKLQNFNQTRYQNLGEWWSERSGNSLLVSQATLHGLCAGSKKNLHSWGKQMWIKIMEDILEGGENGEISHFLERSMLSIVTGKYR
jgi:hypothetical protein